MKVLADNRHQHSYDKTEKCEETLMLIHLMRAALHQTEMVSYREGCNEEKLTEMIVRQSLITLVYPVIESQQGSQWKRIAENLKRAYQREIHKALTQEYEIQVLLDDMEQKKMDCIPMKGWIMRNYYPEPVCRSMCDFDVFIKNFDGEQLKAWMEGMGYTAEKSEDKFHDVYLKRPCMVVELHNCLVDKEVMQEREKAPTDHWMDSIWQRSVLTEGRNHIYQLNDEDFYIHHLLHMYKHFTKSGTGIRSLADIYVFLKEKEAQLNQEYLQRELKRLHLLEFAQNMEKTGKICFGEGEIDKDSILVAAFLTEGGMYGNRKIHESIKILGHSDDSYIKKRVVTTVNVLFPSIEKMEKRYPRLQRCHWLILFYWVKRIGRILVWDRKEMYDTIDAGKKKQYQRIKEIFRVAGVNKQ